jgi:hypothetical protein
MLIGTLSIERQQGRSLLTGASRREAIADAVVKFRPDLLICGGHSLKTNHDLDMLLEDRRIKDGKTAIVVEVERDTSAPKGSCFEHCLYAIFPRGVKQRLGRQVFAVSDDLTGDDGAKNIVDFEQALKTRTFKFRQKTVCVLACGEINILRGRTKVVFRSTTWPQEISDADIIANPTHDRMGNGGTLLAKRRFLSENDNGRIRAYVSSSNWDSKPKQHKRPPQKPTARTLHDYFVSGRELCWNEIQRMHHPDHPRYEYRQANVSLD